MEDKIIGLKEELTELLLDFNNNSNRYFNPIFLKSIRFIGLSGGLANVGSHLGGGAISVVSTSMIDNIKKQIEKKQKNAKFNVHLQKLIIEKNFSNSDVRERANLDKSYFYQILRGEKTPSKDKIMQIAIALNLNIEETNNLFKMQGYVLCGENARDFIILFCIENKLDLMDVNYFLDDFKEKPLV